MQSSAVPSQLIICSKVQVIEADVSSGNFSEFIKKRSLAINTGYPTRYLSLAVEEKAL